MSRRDQWDAFRSGACEAAGLLEQLAAKADELEPGLATDLRRARNIVTRVSEGERAEPPPARDYRKAYLDQITVWRGRAQQMRILIDRAETVGRDEYAAGIRDAMACDGHRAPVDLSDPAVHRESEARVRRQLDEAEAAQARQDERDAAILGEDRP